MRTRRIGIKDYVTHNRKYNECTRHLVREIFQNQKRSPSRYFQSRLRENDVEPLPAPAPEELSPVPAKMYGPVEHSVLSKLAYGSYTNIVLTGEIGCGKTELRRYVLSELQKHSIHDDCDKCSVRQHIRPLVVNFLKGYDLEDNFELREQLWLEVYNQMKSVLQEIFVRKNLIDDFARAVHHGSLARQLVNFRGFVDDILTDPNFVNTHELPQQRNKALFVWIDQHFKNTRMGVIHLANIGRFIRENWPCRMACYVSAFDNIDHLRTSDQIRLILSISGIQEISRFRTLLTVRPELERKIQDIGKASFVFDSVKHLGTTPMLVCLSRIDHFLGARTSDQPEASTEIVHDARAGTTVITVKQAGAMAKVHHAKLGVKITDGIESQYSGVQNIDNKSSRIVLTEPLYRDFKSGSRVSTYGERYWNLVSEECASAVDQLAAHIAEVRFQERNCRDRLAETLRNLSCRSLRRALKLSRRLFINTAVDFQIGSAEIDHLRSALIVGESESGKLDNEDSYVANLFINPRDGSFSLANIRILMLLSLQRNREAGCPLSGLLWDLFRIEPEWTDADVFAAINYLARPYAQLVFIRGRDKYHSPAQMNRSLGDVIHLTELGAVYLERNLRDIRYIQEALLPVEWSASDEVWHEVNWASKNERFLLLRRQLQVLTRVDADQYRSFRDNVGGEVLASYRPYLISSNVVSRVAKIMLTLFPTSNLDEDTRDLYREWASLVNVCNENERVLRRITCSRLSAIYDELQRRIESN